MLRHLPALQACALALVASGASAYDLTGHGGPVRALAVAEGRVLSGSFDTRTILWEGDRARQITRFHEGAVTAVALLPDGRFASGGQDGRAAIWGEGVEPLAVAQAHDLPVAGLVAVPGGLASVGWDGRLVLWPDGQSPQVIPAHEGQITGLALHGGGLASAGADLKVRFWGLDGSATGSVDLPAPPTAVASAGGALVVTLSDGGVLRIGAEGLPVRVAVSDRSLISVAAGDGVVAVAGITGQVWLLDPETLDTRLVIDTGQGAVWSLGLAEGVLLTGGNDGLVRRWTLDGVPLGEGRSAQDPTLTNPRGAEVFRACAVCHTLTEDDGARAGPTLHGIFGRRIATAPGYDYSPALRELDIVWTPETVAELFEYGPEAYTPGSRMPEQRIGSEADRTALVQYLLSVTR